MSQRAEENKSVREQCATNFGFLITPECMVDLVPKCRTCIP